MNDELLIRYLDGEASPDERARVEALGPGDPSARRLWELRERSERFTAAVAAAPVPELPPLTVSRPRRFPWRELRVAAMALLLLAGAAAAFPASRQLLLRGLEAVGVGAGAPAGSTSPVTGSASVILPVESERLVVEVRTRQRSGALVLVRTEGRQIVATAPRAELVFLLDRLSVLNEAEQTDDVTLALPAGVTEVQVEIAGEATLVQMPDGAAPERIPLGR